MKKDLLAKTVALGSFTLAGAALAGGPNWVAPLKPGDVVTVEKCAAVSKAGKNDCGRIGGGHTCAKQSPENDDPKEWVYVPQGVCEKLTGGVVYKTKQIVVKKAK